MVGAGKRRSPSRNGSNAATLKSVLIKTAAWIVAVPLVCATVIVGGAVPLYLLLPDAKPSASPAPQPDAKPATFASARPAAAPGKVASGAPARKREPAADEPAETASIASDDAPAEAAAEAPVEIPEAPQVAAVIPTPRPALPSPAAPAPAKPAADDAEPVDEASIEPPPSADKPQAVAPPALKTGKRDVILRTVTLRSAPWGRELGTLRQGTPVVVGKCDNWCQVTADGATGWIHPSFLTASGAAQRGGDRAVRQVERRRPARDRDPDWLAEDDDRRYGRGDDPYLGAPPAAYYEERPRVLRRRPPPQFYDYYD